MSELEALGSGSVGFCQGRVTGRIENISQLAYPGSLPSQLITAFASMFSSHTILRYNVV